MGKYTRDFFKSVSGRFERIFLSKLIKERIKDTPIKNQGASKMKHFPIKEKSVSQSVIKMNYIKINEKRETLLY